MAVVKDQLAQKGVSREKLDNVYTPIGLKISAETPEEIAVSIMAEIIRIKNSREQGAGYSAELMDEIIHNHQIVPEMLRLILESRFLIMDITQPNFGAYYEAGYAQGLGKEIIVTCQEEVFNQKKYECEFIPKDDKTCWLKEVATKPHFDIAQKQILVWKDYADLTKKLSEWIKFIIG